MDGTYNMILVPVDLEEPQLTEVALKHALFLAEQSQAALRLLHVHPSVPTIFMSEYPQQIAELRDTALQQAEKRLEALAASLPLSPERTSVKVCWGSIYDEILKEAEACGADLIVIGSRRPSMSTYLLGSNAARVVRHASISVLVVR
ncbi:universal stress protein [Edwardsiella piscicida]|uniref:universal stress protein n=1 Tax=Edwardsiella piscicida TaxID=1263550 RepID=UPI0002C08FBD|nr:universal stress protein [Edwardsiella piscicida]AGH73250.1 Universal stress protein G [Edwardsiella piscicida C07-087]EKS7778936.1 universal stress protein [Edwardsiella piscicida]EKS7782356.1 universal stress protein [Edwardsiella piscicida]EKS7812059.1 universal stress protein [Edwardsiella piscicida]UCQ22177.1 universal stress protein [Edwardsiella piscicida]